MLKYSTHFTCLQQCKTPRHMLIDIFHFWFSMRGTIGVLRNVKELMAKIPCTHPMAKENFVEIALRLLAIQDRAESHDQLRSRNSSKKINSLVLKSTLSSKDTCGDKSFRAPTSADILLVSPVDSSVVRMLGHLIPKASKVFPTGSVQPKTVNVCSDVKQAEKTCPGLETIFSCEERAAFVNTTTRVLYITEYLVLVEYTEAVLPMVYALYSVIAFHLPNCGYNQSIGGLSKHELLANVRIVLVYSMLELTSLIVAMLMLKRVLGISPVHQLGFVLESQVTMIQSKLMLWFVYVMQVPLEHVGTDFTFKFKWAHAVHSADMN